MNSHARVLVVSRDEMLLRSREMILGAFFAVRGAGRFSEARTLLTSNNFDLIILCHSLTADECERLAAIAHERCSAMPGSGDERFIASERREALGRQATWRGRRSVWIAEEVRGDGGICAKEQGPR